MTAGLSAEAWARAQRFFPWALRPQIRNPQVRPHWIAGTDRFWYRREAEDGAEYVLVDAADGATCPAFDHAALGRALAAAGMDEDPGGAGIEMLEADGTAARLRCSGRLWRFDGQACVPDPAPQPRPGEALSPDGRLAAFRRGDDLWVRETATGAERPLTQDGAPYFAWAKSPDMNLTTVTLARKGIALPAVVAWAPDSRRLFTLRLDERAVGETPLVQHVPEDGSVRPKLHRMRVALTGDDELPMAHHAVIDAVSGAIVPARCPPCVAGVMTSVEKAEVWWSADSARVFFLDRDRLSRRMTLRAIDAASGAVRDVIAEEATSFVDVNLSVTGLPNVRVLDRYGEVIWFSQRDGWAHLYLHDLGTGALKRRITEGPWVVRDIVRVDEAARQVWFLAGGIDPAANPYHRVLCRAGLDVGGIEVLTPEPGDHALAMPRLRAPRDHVQPARDPGEAMSPAGRFFVHTRGDLEHAPVSALYRADGSLVRVLEEASLAPSIARDWRAPRPLRLTAADGTTALFGALWLPTDFDPARSYPVLDYIYPGPQRGQTPTVALADTQADLVFSALPQAFAELGIAVFNVDGRGTPLRSKAFHDASYGRLDDPGCLEDHVAALRQLLAAHPFLDGGRVGMMGHSGGGYATTRAMLDHPDIYRAGIATAGNHDQKGYTFSWVEKYGGPLERAPDGTTSYDRAANPPFAERLRGKLLLATGDMDDNVHPALTLQLAAALIRADKDFELIVMPNEDHGSLWQRPYFLRRAMDFLVRTLIAPES